MSPNRQVRFKNRRRAAWIAAQGGVCKLCGAKDMLEVDHIEPFTKSYAITDVWSLNSTVRQRELAKCQVLCMTCHGKKTALENETIPYAARKAYRSGIATTSGDEPDDAGRGAEGT